MTGVAHAPGAFESFENNTPKYQVGGTPGSLRGANAALWNLAFCAMNNELKSDTGVGSNFTSNRAGSRKGWVTEGASRFRADPSYFVKRGKRRVWTQGIER